MSYEQYEVFDNLSDLFKRLSEASKLDSEGGKTITGKEIVSICSEILPKIGLDVIDDEPEPEK